MLFCFELLFANYASYQDPTYDWQHDSNSFYQTVQVLFGLLCVCYLGYFSVISYITHQSVKRMKKNYRIVFYYSFLVAFSCTTALAFHGYGGYGERSFIFVAIFALFNIYVVNISFLYSPTWEGFVQMQMEHE